MAIVKSVTCGHVQLFNTMEVRLIHAVKPAVLPERLHVTTTLEFIATVDNFLQVWEESTNFGPMPSLVPFTVSSSTFRGVFWGHWEVFFGRS